MINTKEILSLAGLTLLLLISCTHNSAKPAKSACLFGSFFIEDQTENNDFRDPPFFLAIRDFTSDKIIIYNPEELYLLKFSESENETLHVMDIPPGRYAIYALMRFNENQTEFFSYSDSLVEGTGLTFLKSVTVNAREALYLGDYHIVCRNNIKEEGMLSLDVFINNEETRDTENLRSKSSHFKKYKILTALVE